MKPGNKNSKKSPIVTVNRYQNTFAFLGVISIIIGGDGWSPVISSLKKSVPKSHTTEGSGAISILFSRNSNIVAYDPGLEMEST